MKKKTKTRRQSKQQRECSLGILELAANSAGFSMLEMMRGEDAVAAQEFQRKNPGIRGYP